jgi:redox-sensitive bicupin YhaK (pirin superfamily)
MATLKDVIEVTPAPAPHWVGDGFPVRSLFSAHSQDPAAISPFLLLDYAGPKAFPPMPDGRPRGVDEHPHRGFETVTIVYQGEIEHRDSSGSSGHIGPGDVQWMTAASGVVHEEKHGSEFTRQGGTLEMVQFWVNLPKSHKMAEPGYQAIRDAMIPSVALADEAGQVRVIAGSFDQAAGPAKTVTRMNVWDIRLETGGQMNGSLPDGWNTLVVVLGGEATVNGRVIQTHQCARLGGDGDGDALQIEAGGEGATLLLLSGEPIDEPVVAEGPFVMTSKAEIMQAMKDYQSGRMGSLASRHV